MSLPDSTDHPSQVTLADLDPPTPKTPKTPSISNTLEKKQEDLSDEEEQQHAPSTLTEFSNFSKARKYTLLCVFNTAVALDIVQMCSLYCATTPISEDVGLKGGNDTWAITAYSMTFASFLLMSGRLADIFPAQWVFGGGFLGVGICSLVTSFVTNMYGFLILRALTGVFASLTVPSAYHLIVHVFTDPLEQKSALGTLGLTSGLSASLGVLFGGLFELGNSNWKWMFRFFAFLALFSTLIGFLLMPTPQRGHLIKGPRDSSILRRLDLFGVLLLTGSILLFILGLTSGSTDGWRDPHFIAPFVISFVLFAGFFVWEAQLKAENSLFPHEYWKLPNMKLLAFATLMPYMYWPTIQVAYANYWQQVSGYTAMLSAARLLPQGLAGLTAAALAGRFPILLAQPKYTIVVCSITTLVAYVLNIYSGGGHGADYWRYCVPGLAIGSASCNLIYMALNQALVESVPRSASGVAGGALQCGFQIGGVIGLSVTAGLMSLVDNDIANWRGTQDGWWFLFAWTAASGMAVAVLYRKVERKEKGDDNE